MNKQKTILNSLPGKEKEATNKQAFTLVELIVVITILAILGTIGFINLQGFSSDTRDSKRISELSEIRNGLQIYQARNSLLPTPSEQTVTIGSGTTDLIIQGYAGVSVLNEIRMNGNPKDPLKDDNKYYIYSVNANKTKFQLLSLLENNDNLTSFNNLNIIPTTHASYINRFPYTVGGGTVGIILDETTNTPIQELTTSIDLNTDTNNYKVIFLNNNQSSTLSGELLYNEIVTQTNNNGITQNNITCPTGYIFVPGNSTFTTSDFCVAKYEMKDVGGVATSQATGTPWVSITQPNAITACNDLGTGYHLITNNEWMTIARNIEANSVNWANGEVGSLVSTGGGLFRGNINLNDTVSCGNGTPLDGDTVGTNCDASGRNKRMHILSNGSEIWDISGNVWEHVNRGNNTTTTGIQTSNFTGDGTICGASGYWYTDGNPSSVCGPTQGPINRAGGSDIGMGYVWHNTNTDRVFIRGGAWGSPPNAGVFELYLDADSTVADITLGFRCAFSVN